MSSKSSKKQLRRQAVAGEMGRRFHDAETQSPLTRPQLDALLDHLAERMADRGHSGDFTHTREWLANNGHGGDIDAALEFFRARGMTDDWSLATEGDPHQLFGPTETHFRRMPIAREALEALLDHVDAHVRAAGCDHSLRVTREWLAQHGHPVHPTAFALMSMGGYCDCEVVMNVEPENIFRD